jgi:hypothetical protein
MKINFILNTPRNIIFRTKNVHNLYSYRRIPTFRRNVLPIYSWSTLKMEAALSIETVVAVYETIWRHNVETNLNNHPHENLTTSKMINVAQKLTYTNKHNYLYKYI